MIGKAPWRLVLVITLVALGGCSSAAHQPNWLSGGQTDKAGRQAADVQYAMGRALDQQDESGSLRAYKEAVKRDPSRADAALRAARKLDELGKFAESEEYYIKAESASPGSAKVACNHGYSLYLQERWVEAEKALRLALVRQPDLKQAHTNLGLLLAQTGRADEALAEFHKAGLHEADARVNLAFALTLKKAWPLARAEYTQALAADPSSVPAKEGLAQLENLMARSTGSSSPAQPQSNVPIHQEELGATAHPVSFAPAALASNLPPPYRAPTIQPAGPKSYAQPQVFAPTGPVLTLASTARQPYPAPTILPEVPQSNYQPQVSAPMPSSNPPPYLAATIQSAALACTVPPPPMVSLTAYPPSTVQQPNFGSSGVSSYRSPYAPVLSNGPR